MQNRQNKAVPSIRKRENGFSLVELMVTLGVFLVISAAAFSLVTKHIPVFTSQQTQATLNFGLRNAAAQLQVDTVNAGSGFYPAANSDVTSWPIAVTIQPGSDNETNCYNPTTHTYSQQCFDTINVIRSDPNVPPVQIGKQNGSEQDCDSNSMSIANSSTLFVLPVSPMTADQVANTYKIGDQVLIISAREDNKVGTVILTSVQKTGTGVKFGHNQNVNTTTNDHYLISTKSTNKIKTDFCTGDWVVKLSPAVYRVDASNPANPKIARLHPDDPDCPPTAVTPFKSQCIIAEQVIGFKVGALLYAPPTVTDDCKPYCYVPENYGSDWSNIRAVRMTIIGRTPPDTGPNPKRNGFDNGPYKIDAISIVVSPRSLTMRDES